MVHLQFRQTGDTDGNRDTAVGGIIRAVHAIGCLHRRRASAALVEPFPFLPDLIRLASVVTG